MGNLNNCCKGRDQKLNNSDLQEEATENGEMDKSRKSEDPHHSFKNEFTSHKDNNNNEMKFISVDEFNTFGGFGALNSKKQETNQIVLENIKESLFDDFEDREYTFRELVDMKQLIPTFKKIYLQISIDSFTYCSNFDDYGVLLRPVAEISLENHDDLNDGNKNKKFQFFPEKEILNNSNISDLDASAIMNTSQTGLSNNSFINMNKKEKIFEFKNSTAKFELTRQFFYSKLNFIIYNGLKTGENKSSLFNILIGSRSIPLNIVMGKIKLNSLFNGFIEINLRKAEYIGNLKIRLNYSEDESELFDFEENIGMLSFENEDNLNYKDFKEDILSSQNKSLLNKMVYYVDELDPDIVERFFESNEKSSIKRDYALSVAIRKTCDKNAENFNTEKFLEYYTEAEESKSQIVLFQIISTLTDLVIGEKLQEFEQILKKFKENRTGMFTDLYSKSKSNVFILCGYFTLIYHYESHMKNNKSYALKVNKESEDSSTISNIFEILNKFSEFSEISDISYYQIELKNLVSICLNILSLLVSQPENASRLTKEEKRLEHSLIYNNSICVISGRNSILRLTTNYITASEMISSIVRVLRKTIQNLTCASSYIDKSKFKMDPKELSSQLKKILIEKSKGAFVSTLKSILLKYHHYTEIHKNVLIISTHITSTNDFSLLSSAAETLNLNLVREVFEIYRGKLTGQFKVINYFHLNLLANLTDSFKSNLDNVSDNILKAISLDLKMFYVSDKKIKEFNKKLRFEIDILSTICKISSTLSIKDCSVHVLFESTFFQNLIVYLTEISKSDFLTNLREKKKNMKNEEIKKYVSIIVENSIVTIANILLLNENNRILFLEKTSISILDLINILEKCRNIIEKYSLNLTLVDKYLFEIKNEFQE